MVSKVLDVYMKYTGLDYLSAILKDIIHTIVENDYFIEVRFLKKKNIIILNKLI